MDELNVTIIAILFFITVLIMLITVLLYSFFHSKKRIQEEIQKSVQKGFADQPKFVRNITKEEKDLLYVNYNSYARTLEFVCLIFLCLLIPFVYISYSLDGPLENRIVAVGVTLLIGSIFIYLFIYISSIFYRLYFDVRSPLYRAKGLAQLILPHGSERENVLITVNFYVDNDHQYLRLFPALLTDEQKKLLFYSYNTTVTIEYTAYTKTIISITLNG